MEVLRDVSPITDHSEKLVIEFVSYSIDSKPKYTVEECKERDANYAAPLKVNVRLTNKETGEVKQTDIFTTVAPMRRRISSDREISFTGGMFSSVQVPRTRMVANKIGSAAFFIPLMVTSPQSGFPPCIMILLAMLIPNGRKPRSAFLSRRTPFASFPYHYIITLEKRKAFFYFFQKKIKRLAVIMVCKAF